MLPTSAFKAQLEDLSERTHYARLTLTLLERTGPLAFVGNVGDSLATAAGWILATAVFWIPVAFLIWLGIRQTRRQQ